MSRMRRKEFPVHGRHGRPGRLVCCLAMCAALLLTACGQGSAADGSAAGAARSDSNVSAGSDLAAVDLVQGPEYVYVPEPITVDDNRADYGGMQQVGNDACYISMSGEAEGEAQSICRYSLTDRELSRTAIQWTLAEPQREICAYVFDQDGSVWLIVNAYPADYSKLSRYLCKFDPEGKSLFSQEVTEQLGRDISIEAIVTDSQGRLYIYTDAYTDEAGIWLYTADGSYHGSVRFGSAENVLIRGTAEGKDGRFYACVGPRDGSGLCTLMEVEFEKGQLVELTKEFPDVSGISADPAGQYDLLLYDDIHAYGYDLSAQKEAAEELFAWGDSDVNGYFVEKFGVLEDGRYFCTVEDWEHEDLGIVLLTKTKAEEAPKRENLVLATVGGGGSLSALAVGFGRSSDRYHLTVRNYDSLTDLYNALLAKETIDIIDLSGVDVEKLAGQDVFADLAPYLEQSQAFDTADFLEGILEAYTFDGTLTGIPDSFTLQTVAADSTLLGGGTALSLEGLLAAADRNPGALPFDGMTREEMMRYLMMFNEDAFIDWEAGECHFDSQQFKDVLEYMSRFPDSLGAGKGDVSMPTKVQNGQVLFALADLRRLDDFQLYQGIFGENAACVGFPARDGKGKALLFAENAYGITAVSENKDGAWEFIEDVLTRIEPDGMSGEEIYMEYTFPSRFPVLKGTWDAMTAYKMASDSQRPSDRFHAAIYEEDGWYFQYHAVTREEIDVILDLLKEATPAFSVEKDDVINIINEEASGYYSGQKGIDDVVNVIQNRIQLYVSENS
ncbi:MAG: extracellular solute-binding protein [Lachnospiraceae bacterium]|nr:extracellular solute-binding protein [Lachnospiraceae bacterium]MCM1238362.1 extracellular solute-binding protein [Lachnospiraceae bacterium]